MNNPTLNPNHTHTHTLALMIADVLWNCGAFSYSSLARVLKLPSKLPCWPNQADTTMTLPTSANAITHVISHGYFCLSLHIRRDLLQAKTLCNH